MIDTIERVEQLETGSRSQETTLVQLEADIAELEHDLAPFRARYNRIVQPMVERLEAAKSAVAEMEHYHHMAQPNDERPITSSWDPGTPAKAIPEGSLQPTADSVMDSHRSRLKRLYRQLVRCFHPDLASDVEEISSRNRLLTLINDAYAKRDLTTLEVLMSLSGSDNPQAGLPKPTSTVQLEWTHAELAARVEELTQARDSLLHGEWMDLKIKAKFAQRLGRDLLREIADSLEKEYEDYIARLARLRPPPGASDAGKVHPAPKEGAPESPSLLLHFSFVGRNEEIVISLKPGEQIVLGRAAQMASRMLLDLTPYGARELGVSRKHATIVLRGPKRAYYDVRITDMGSTNGTYLNGQRVTPKVPHRLGNGDEICLGHLRIRVRYDQTGTPFLEHVRLYNLSSKSSWETNQQTWAEALELALIYGCRSTRGAGDDIYGSGVRVSDEDAQVLADALERALPHLPAEPPRVVAGCLDSQRIEPPVWYFGGRASKQKIRDLIAFCRQGAFKVEAS